MSVVVASITKYPIPGILAILFDTTQFRSSLSTTPQVSLEHISTSCTLKDTIITCRSKYRFGSSATITSMVYKLFYGNNEVTTANFSNCNLNVNSGDTIDITLTESYGLSQD